MRKVQPTKKQIEILLLLYKFRFLHTYQIQTLLDHKKSNRIKAWLKDLTQKEYIRRDYTPTAMNKKPAIYSLTLISRDLLKKRKECQISVLNKIYREKERSKVFINHCLVIADIYIKFKSLSSDKIYFGTKNDLVNFEIFPKHLPDAYIAIKNSRRTVRYFLEVVDEYLPRFALRYKIERYIEYYESDKWAEYTDKPFPSILIISPSDVIKKYTKRFVAKTLDENPIDINFLVTTMEEINNSESFKSKYSTKPSR